MADMMAGQNLQQQFGQFLSGMGGQGLTAQQAPVNIDALRKISDPRIMQMAAQMLMQRAYQERFSPAPGWLQYVAPQGRPKAVQEYYLGERTSPHPPETTGMSDKERADYYKKLRQKKLESGNPLDIISRKLGTATATTSEEIPSGLKDIWPDLDEEEKADIRVALKRGVTKKQIMDAYRDSRK
jgi:hypothetical protein